MKSMRLVSALLFVLTLAFPLSAQITQGKDHTWSLVSGAVEYRLQQTKDAGGMNLIYFGPKGGASWPGKDRPELHGIVEGATLSSRQMTLVRQEVLPGPNGSSELHLFYRHKLVPIQIEVIYKVCGTTGVITRHLVLHNTGQSGLAMESVPSLSWRLPGDSYEASYLHGDWGEERQLSKTQLTFAGFTLTNRKGRSSAGFAPWFVLHGSEHKVTYAAELAYSGNWDLSMTVDHGTRHAPLDQSDVDVDMGMRFDFGGAGRLCAGATFESPEVAYTASAGDMDDVANQLHQYQREFVFAHTPWNTPPAVTFNPWQMLWRMPSATEVKKYADLIAPLGVEALVIDSGWFHHAHEGPGGKIDPKAYPIFGDWQTEPDLFPKGLHDISDYVHGKGMKFGLWIELETVSRASITAREHLDWLLTYDGKPIAGGANRVYLNFGNPQARAWARATMERLITQDGLDWMKLDYNVNPGEMFDPADTSSRSGTVLHDHLTGYYSILADVKRAHPNVVLENCASGGLRADIGILHYTDTQWTSDVIEPQRNVQLVYGCSVEFAPEICEHWLVGDSNGGASGDSEHGEVSSHDSPAWMKTMVRLTMPGQMGMSSRVDAWPPAFRETVVEGIKDYKRIRPILAASNTYHLTPPPAAGSHPEGWMALEFATQTADKAVLLAFRLEGGAAEKTLHLRGLNASDIYQVRGDGVAPSHILGAELMEHGVTIHTDAEWSSSLVEITRLGS